MQWTSVSEVEISWLKWLKVKRTHMALERTVEFREEVLASDIWRREGCCSVEREQSRCDEDDLQELESAQSSAPGDGSC